MFAGRLRVSTAPGPWVLLRGSEMEGAVHPYWVAAIAVVLGAAALHIWQTKRRIRRMAAAIETFDLGNFEKRLAKAAGGSSSLGTLAAKISDMNAALMMGASTVSTTASSTIAEKDAHAERMREIFGERVREVLGCVETAVTEIGNTASSMHQLVSDTEKYSAEAVTAVASASSNVAGVADGVGRLSESIGRISETVGTTAKKSDLAVAQANQANNLIQTLAHSAQTIGEVVTIINGIAKQSNLLALNATIEAARAGAAGRSFAVVAREVKTLAGQTVHATEDIRRQVNGIQSATQSAVGAVGAIGAVIREFNQLSGDMRISINSQYEAARDIASFANSAREATGALTERMKSVDNAIQANSLAGECIQQTAAELNKRIATLAGETQTLLHSAA
jgi:methyl-accepting chemotaxis protein